MREVAPCHEEDPHDQHDMDVATLTSRTRGRTARWTAANDARY
jgi:hypothetical protein